MSPAGTKSGKRRPIYKTSRYNIICDVTSGYAIYNSRTGAYLHIAKNKNAQLGVLDKPNRECTEMLASLDQRFRSALIEGGYVIPDNFDELGFLRYKCNLRKYNSSSINLTILQTARCNLDCVYCYENKNSNSMSKVVEDRICNYISNQLKDGAKRASVIWFGGEPLLRHKKLCGLSKRFQQICKKSGAEYVASIITNGVLLDDVKVDELLASGIASAQITLDGAKDIHDKRRRYANAKGTFDTILENTISASDRLNIILRINVDKINFPTIPSLLDILKEKFISDKIRVYFSPLRPEGSLSSPSNNTTSADVYTAEEFAAAEIHLKKYCCSIGVAQHALPTPADVACASCSCGGMVIEPEGNILKCFNMVGSGHGSVGNVRGGLLFDNEALEWMFFDPTEREQCAKCKILPLCMGGCPYRVMRRGEDGCMPLKYNIVEQLRLFYLQNQGSPTKEGL
jgi:uncharacterized protein